MRKSCESYVTPWQLLKHFVEIRFFLTRQIDYSYVANTIIRISTLSAAGVDAEVVAECDRPSTHLF